MRTSATSLGAALCLLVLAACATSPKEEPPIVQTEPPSPFPVPAGLEPQIHFWRNVYAVWGQDKAVLHDDQYLNLVYEVIALPGPKSDGYTQAQRRFVRTREDALRHRLRALETKLARAATLSPGEQQLAEEIKAAAGPRAVFGASARLRSQRGLRERFKRGLEISGRYDALFREVFQEAGLPEDFAYLPHVESSFQSHAKSSAGAVGMWQFTRPAARTYMTNHPALDERLDPVASARGAARYLSDAYGRLGAWPLAVTSYNHGIGGMQRAKGEFGTEFVRIVYHYQHPYFGFASRNFYAEFLAAREIASNPQRFFPEGVDYEPPLDWDRVVLNRSTPASALASRYCVSRHALTQMNPAWTHAARDGRVPLPAGTEIWLPTGTLQRTAQACSATQRTYAMAENAGPGPDQTPSSVQ